MKKWCMKQNVMSFIAILMTYPRGMPWSTIGASPVESSQHNPRPRHSFTWFLGGLIHSPQHIDPPPEVTKNSDQLEAQHPAVNKAWTSFHIPDLIQISCLISMSTLEFKPSWQILYTQYLNSLGKYPRMSSPSILSKMFFSQDATDAPNARHALEWIHPKSAL